ncbi:MAG TPA: hypothetical protein VGI96_01505 [Streptosporangiaceae bacterium]|jgi:hypothetical protein
MDRERAETYLRVLAEAELRRATSQLPGNAPRPGHAARVKRAAQVLTFVGALDDGVAEEILDDFALALGARQPGQIGPVLESFSRRTQERAQQAGRGSIRPAAAVMTAASSGTGMAAGRMHTPVPLGQTIPVRGTDARSEVFLLSYMRVSSGPQFSVFARTRDPSGRWEPAGPRLFDPFTAVDDQGTSYQVIIRDIGSPVLGWTLMVRSSPRHDPRWLDLATTADGPAARIVLSSAADSTWPPDAMD